MFELQGKTAIVTGGGSGIGAAIATLFASRGARVALFDREQAAADAVADRIRESGGGAVVVRCDVSNASEVQAAFREFDAAHGRLDILVNNAGIAHIGTIQQTSPDDLDRLYRVNVRGVYLCARQAIDRMLPQGGGVILNMASIAALIGLPERFAYSMTKGAVLAMTRAIAMDYVKRGIRCNCICPARIHTPFVDGYLASHYPGKEQEMFQTLSNAQPIGRMGTPDEVAALALYLCSSEAAFVTGQAYPIDGGAVCG